MRRKVPSPAQVALRPERKRALDEVATLIRKGDFVSAAELVLVDRSLAQRTLAVGILVQGGFSKSSAEMAADEVLRDPAWPAGPREVAPTRRSRRLRWGIGQLLSGDPDGAKTWFDLAAREHAEESRESFHLQGWVDFATGLNLALAGSAMAALSPLASATAAFSATDPWLGAACATLLANLSRFDEAYGDAGVAGAETNLVGFPETEAAPSPWIAVELQCLNLAIMAGIQVVLVLRDYVENKPDEARDRLARLSALIQSAPARPQSDTPAYQPTEGTESGSKSIAARLERSPIVPTRRGPPGSRSLGRAVQLILDLIGDVVLLVVRPGGPPWSADSVSRNSIRPFRLPGDRYFRADSLAEAWLFRNVARPDYGVVMHAIMCLAHFVKSEEAPSRGVADFARDWVVDTVWDARLIRGALRTSDRQLHLVMRAASASVWLDRFDSLWITRWTAPISVDEYAEHRRIQSLARAEKEASEREARRSAKETEDARRVAEWQEATLWEDYDPRRPDWDWFLLQHAKGGDAAVLAVLRAGWAVEHVFDASDPTLRRIGRADGSSERGGLGTILRSLRERGLLSDAAGEYEAAVALRNEIAHFRGRAPLAAATGEAGARAIAAFRRLIEDYHRPVGMAEFLAEASARISAWMDTLAADGLPFQPDAYARKTVERHIAARLHWARVAKETLYLPRDAPGYHFKTWLHALVQEAAASVGSDAARFEIEAALTCFPNFGPP